MSGFSLFQKAEMCYHKGDTNGAFENYQKSIKKILRDENPTALIPGSSSSMLPPDCPLEVLGIAWRNFVGFFRDSQMNFTEASHPDAYKLLKSFRPSAPKPHTRLERTERGKLLLKGMQVSAALTLGLLAWDKHDRATAAKRYREGIELAETHRAFIDLPPGTRGMECYVHNDLRDVKDNLGILIANDEKNAKRMRMMSGATSKPRRKEQVELPGLHARVDKTGAVGVEGSYTFATDACVVCGKRDVKLMRCSRCKNNRVQYCGGECQKTDWKKHKASCVVKA